MNGVDVQVDVEEPPGLAAVRHVAGVVGAGEVEQEPEKEKQKLFAPTRGPRCYTRKPTFQCSFLGYFFQKSGFIA